MCRNGNACRFYKVMLKNICLLPHRQALSLLQYLYEKIFLVFTGYYFEFSKN